MKRMQNGTALTLVLGLAAGNAWSIAGAQSLPPTVSATPPLVAANPNTSIDVTPAGTPIVNIAAPRADGTSYNEFTKLNVGREGLIFNNSTEIGRSQIGGQILANGRLAAAGTSASLILNEVTGGTRSDLKGVIEVFGGRAALVIANPSGITCNGCGFINVSRAALATGRVTFGSDGAFTGFDVSGGDVLIEGRGLLAGNVDFFDVVTQSASINAALYARDLVIAGGSASYDYATRTATAKPGSNDRLALDSSLLGGIYANRIRLIGTSAGVGINLRGVVNALEGALVINADGAITVRSVAAAADVDITSARSTINIDERVYSGAKTTINAAGNIVLAGDFVGAADSVALRSGGDIQLGGAGLYAGLNQAGRFEGAADLRLDAAGTIEAGAVQAIAAGGIALAANDVVLGAESAFSARDIALRAGRNLVGSGSIQATGSLGLAGSDVRLAGNLVANNALAIDGQTIVVSGRTIGLASLTARADQILTIGQGGDLQSAGFARITGSSIDNAGRVLGIGGVVVDAARMLANSGAILSGGDALVTSGGDAALAGVINANGTTSLWVGGAARIGGTVAAAGDVTLAAGEVALQGTLSSGARLTATSIGVIDSGGQSAIVANEGVSLNAGKVTIAGLISSGAALDLAGRDEITLNGQTNVIGKLTASSAALTVGGIVISDSEIALQSTGAVRIDGLVSARDLFSIDAGTLASTAGAQAIAGGTLRFTSASDIVNAGAISAIDLTLDARGALRNQGALFGADKVALLAGAALEQSGSAQSRKVLTLTANSIALSGNNTGLSDVRVTANTDLRIASTSLLQSGGTLALGAGGRLDTDGIIVAVGDFAAQSGADFSQRANIELGRAGRFTASGDLILNGLVTSAGAIDLRGASISGNGSLFSDADIALRASSAQIDLSGTLSARSSLLFDTRTTLALRGNAVTDGVITLSTTDLLIDGDVASARGYLATVADGATIGNRGALRSGVGLSLNVATLSNSGLISANGPLTLGTRDEWVNLGQISGGDSTTIVAGRDLTNDGIIQANGALQIRANDAATLRGSVVGAQSISLAAGEISVAGTIAAGSSAKIDAAGNFDVANSGIVSAQAAITARASDAISNRGSIVSDTAIALDAGGGFITVGSIESGGAIAFSGSSLNLGGVVSARGALGATTPGSLALEGVLSAGGGIAFDAATYRDSDLARITSGGVLGIIASGLVEASGRYGSVGGIEISSGAISTTTRSAFETGGAIDLFSRGDLRLAGTTSSDLTTTLRAAGHIVNAGEIAAIGNVDIIGASVDVSGNARSNSQLFAQATGDALTINGAAFAAGNINLVANNALTIGGIVQADRGLGLRGGDLAITGDVTGIDRLLALATDNLVASATSRIQSNGALDLAGGGIHVAGQVYGGALGFTTPGALSISGTALSADSFDIAAGTLDVRGTLQSGSSFRIATTGALGLGSGASLLSGGNLSLVSQTRIDALGAIASIGDTQFSALSDITATGRIATDRSIDIVGRDIGITGPIIAQNGLSVTGRRINVNAPAIIESGTALNLTSVDLLLVNGTLRALGQASLRAGNVVTLNGITESGRDTILDAGQLLSVTGTARALGTINFTAARASIDGLISAGSLIQGNADDVTANGRLAAGSTISLIGANGLTLSGASVLESDGGIALNAAKLNADGIVRANSNVTLTGTSELANNGQIEAGGRIDLVSAGLLTSAGVLRSLGNLSLAGGSSDLAGILETNGTIIVRASDLHLRGALRSGGALDIVATNGVASDAGATLIAGTTLALAAGNSASIHGRADAGTSAALSAANALTIIGTISSGGGLTLTSGTDLTNSGQISSLGALSLQAGGLLYSNGSIASAETLIASAAATTLAQQNVIFADGAIRFSSGAGLTTGGTIDANGGLSLVAGLAFDQNAILRAGGAIDLIAGGLFTNNGRIETPSTLDLKAAAIASSGSIIADRIATVTTQSGDLSISGALSSASGLSLTSARDVTIGGALNTENILTITGHDVTIGGAATGRDRVTIDAQGALALAGASSVISEGDVALRAGSNLRADGATFSGGSSLFNANGLLSLAGNAQSIGAVTLAGGTLDLGGVLATDAALSARSLGALSLTGRVDARTGVTLSSGAASFGAAGRLVTAGALVLNADSLASSATIFAGTGISLATLGALSQSGIIDSAGIVTLSGGSVSLGGDVIGRGGIAIGGGSIGTAAGARLQSGSDLSLISRGALTLAGRFDAVRDVTATALGDVLQNASIVSGGGARFDGAGRFTNNGTIDTTGSLTIVGRNLANNGRIVSDADLALTNISGTALLGGTVSGRSGVALLSSGDVSLSGALVSGAALSADVTGSLSTTISGDVRANGAISAAASTAIINEGAISSGGALNFTTPLFTSSGILETSRAFALTAQSINLQGRLASTDAITLRATNGLLDLGASLAGTIVSLTSTGGDLVVRNGTFIDATHSASLLSNRNITLGGQITANNGISALTTGGAITLGSIAGAQSLGNIVFAASGAIASAGTLRAGGTIDLSGSQITSGAILANGAIALRSTGAIHVDNVIDTARSATLIAAGGGLNVTNAGAVSTGDALAISAAGAISNAGDLVAETTLTAISGATLTNTGFIFSDTGGSQLGATTLVLGGDVISNAALALNARDIVIGGSVGTDAAFGLSADSLAILGGGRLQSNRAINLAIGSAQIDGTLRALETIDLTAASLRIGSSGLIDGRGRLSGTISGLLNNSGVIGVTGTLALSAATFDSSGTITATNIATVNAGSFGLSGLLQSGSDLTIASAASSIAGTGSARATGSLTILGDTFTNAGEIGANNAVAITGRNALTIAGTSTIFSNSRSVDLISAGATSVGGRIDSATDLRVSGNTVQFSGVGVAGGNVSINAAGGALGVNGSLTSGASIALGANAGDLTVGGASNLFASSGITANARRIDGQGRLLSPGAISLTAQSGLTLSGALISNNAVGLAGGTSLSIANSGTIDAASAVLSGATLTSLGRVDVSGAVRLSATDSASISGLVSASGPINFSAPGSANLTIAASGGLVSGSSITLQNIGALTVAGIVSARTDATAAFTGLGTIGGRVEAGGTIGLTNASNQALSVGGVIAAGTDVILAGGTLTVPGLVYAGRNLAFSTASYGADLNSLSVSGALIAGGAINLATAGGLLETNTGIIAADGAIDYVGAFANIAGTISAGTNLTFTTRNNLQQAGAPFRDVSLSGTAQSGGALRIAAISGIDASTNSRILSNSSVTLGGSDVIARGTIGAAGPISLSGDYVTVTGLVQSGNRVALAATQNVTLGTASRIETLGIAVDIGFARDAGASANIDILAGSILSNSGTIYSNGAIALKSETREIINSGAITGLTSVVLQAESDEVLSSGTITGANLAIYQGNRFYNSGNFGAYTATGNFLLSAPSITNSGLLGAGRALILRSFSNVDNLGGTIFAGGEIAIEASGTINNDLGTILAVGNIGLSALSLVNNSARIESLAGDVNIQAANVTNQIRNLVVEAGQPGTEGTPAGLYDERGGYAGPIPDAQQSRIFSFGSGGTYILRQVLIDLDFIYLPGIYTERDEVPGTPGTDDTVTTNSGASQIIAARDINITTGGNDRGVVTNNNSSILAGRNISIIAGTLNNIATLLNRTNSGLGQEPLPTRINAGGTVTLNVGTLNNNQPALGNQSVVGSGGGTPGITLIGASAQGGRSGYADPNTPIAGLTNAPGVARSASGGQVVQRRSIVVARGDATSVNANAEIGAGAGTIGTAFAATLGANGAALDASDPSTTTTGGNIAVGNAVRGSVVGAIDQAGATIGTAPGGASNNPTSPTAISVGAPGSQAGSGPAIGTPGGFVDSLINRVGGVRPAGANGASVGEVAAIGTIAVEGALEASAIQVAPISDVDLVAPDTLINDALDGIAAQDAQTVRSIGGLAVPDILGGGGQVGGFVFDFLRSFGLVASGTGFDLAGGGGLFTFNNNPDSEFLFTTNPGFASTAALFDSDFFFTKAGVDRNTRFTRLGDGFFEAQLIAKQVQASTGQAQLDAFADSFAQATGLLQAGLDQAARLKLSVGVALSPEQVAGLTSSVVWYVKSTVQGREVLVPVVYLAAADQKTIQNGAIISGTNIVANVTGDITNNSTIAASKIVSLTAGGDIVNQAGGRIAGGTLVASAARDILAQGGSSFTGGNILLAAGRDVSLSSTISTSNSSETSSVRSGKYTNSSTTRTTSQSVTGAELAATGNLVVSAQRDIALSAAKVSAGGDAALNAGRDITLAGVSTTTTTDSSWKTGKYVSGTSSGTATTYNGSSITAGGNLSLAAGDKLAITGSNIAAGGNAILTGANGVNISAATETASAALNSRTSKRNTVTSAQTSSTNLLSSVTAGGNLALGAVDASGAASGQVIITGAQLAATGNNTIVGNSVAISGVIDSATAQSTTIDKKKSFLSSKKTTTVENKTSETVAASTVSGAQVNINAAAGDINVRGANIVSADLPGSVAGLAGGTTLAATGNVDIGTLLTRSTEDKDIRVKKSGLSFGDGGFFIGVSKSQNASTLETLANTGSLIGSANGDVAIRAGQALNITGSQIATPGTLSLFGESVSINNATDIANSTSLARSSSFGVSISAYENVSGAVKSVATLGDRIGQGGKGAAGTAITAASETLRSIAAVTSALTNTAGVTASIGFSKSKSTTATQEQAVVGSTIAGGTVNVTARETDVRVTGSSITSSGDTSITATRDVILESAENQINSQFKSSSSGASLSANIGVAVVGGVTASASVSVSASHSSGTSTEVSQANSQVAAGGTLALTTGRDAVLKGAVAQGQNVVANIGRDLSVTSVQDTSARQSTSAGFSAGLTLATGVGIGANGSISVGKGSGASSIVTEQTALIAREGSLAATVKGNTDLKGGVIAALDKDGKDSGQLSLTTGTLTASDIKDSAKSKDISLGISASINNVTDRKTAGANLPVIEGSFASSSFAQDTKATIGQGVLNVGVPDASVTINRDIDAAQVVTKDKQTGFTIYADAAAAKQLESLVKGAAGDEGAAANSVIISGAKKLVNDPLAVAKDVVKEVKANADGTPFNSKLEELTATVEFKLGTLDVDSILRRNERANGRAIDAQLDSIDEQIAMAAAANDTALVDELKIARVKVEELGRTDIIAGDSLALAARLQDPAAPQNVKVRDLIPENSTRFAISTPDKATLFNAPPAPASDPYNLDELTVIGRRIIRVDGESTIGRVVVDGLIFSQKKVESFSPLTKSIAVLAVKTALTGGTGPILEFGIDQATGRLLPLLPTSIVKPIADGVEAVNTFVGDGGSAILLRRNFADVRADDSVEARTDSSASAFGVGILASGAIATVGATAKVVIKKRRGGDGVDAPPAPPPPPPPPLRNLEEILPNINTRVLSKADADALTSPNRGVIYVQENASMSPAARQFQAGCAGAFCDVASRSDAAPALRYDNNVTNGNNYIRFDGIERRADGQGIVLIDRKTFLADFGKKSAAKTESTLRRIAEAVKQNPGYQVVYEFPNAAAQVRANMFIAGIVKERPELAGAVTTRLAGPK